MRELLLTTLTVTTPRLDARLAQRTFEALYPRLVIPSRGDMGFLGADEAISAAQVCSPLLELSRQLISPRSRMSSWE